MKTRTPEAARLEQDYLERLRAALAASPAATGEAIRQDVRDHIESALGESAAEPVALTQMAAVLERLGPPEACAMAEEVGPSGAPTPTTPADAGAWANVLDRLWWAFLIAAIGLYVPVVDFMFCEIAGLALVLAAIRRLPGGAPDSFRTLTPHAAIALALTVASSPLTVWTRIAPVFALLAIPVALAGFAWQLIVYAKCMGGAATLVERLNRADLANSIRTSRRIFIGSYVGITAILAVLIVVIHLVGHGATRRGIPWRDEIFIACIMLPVSWLLGGLFAVRPLGQARAALRESATVPA